MDYYLEALEKKMKELQKLIETCKSELVNAPKGAVQVSTGHCGCQYYHSYQKGKKNVRKYIKKEDEKLAYELAQCDYLRRVQSAAEAQVRGLQKAKVQYMANEPEAVFEKLNEKRKHLVSSLYESDEEFIEKWLKEIPDSVNPYPIETEIYTNSGEHVRSKSERIIADELFRLGIPYKYEAVLKLEGKTIVYPDFTVLNVKTRKTWYLEHLGMLDKEEYMQNTFYKMNRYIQQGIIPGKNLIVTYEKSDSPLSTKTLDILIKTYLM